MLGDSATNIQTHRHSPLSTRHNTQVQTRQNLHPLVPNTIFDPVHKPIVCNPYKTESEDFILC